MILECGHPPSASSGLGVGYGRDPKTGERHCYECCAKRDIEQMIADGKATLYLSHDKAGSLIECQGFIKSPKRTWSAMGQEFHYCTVHEHWKAQNWPGSLNLKVTRVSHGKSWGFGGWQHRVDVQFLGPNGEAWYGRNQGESQILVAKRRKVA